jgi:hypothetical protein
METNIKSHATTFGAIALLLVIASCATRVPDPAELQAKRFETIPDKSAVYLYRDRPDFSSAPASLTLDGQPLGSVYAGTFFRLELAPGRHRIAGYAGDSGVFEFSAEAGKLYFVRQIVSRFLGFDQSLFYVVSAEQGRNAVLRYEMLGAR